MLCEKERWRYIHPVRQKLQGYLRSVSQIWESGYRDIQYVPNITCLPWLAAEVEEKAIVGTADWIVFPIDEASGDEDEPSGDE